MLKTETKAARAKARSKSFKVPRRTKAKVASAPKRRTRKAETAPAPELEELTSLLVARYPAHESLSGTQVKSLTARLQARAPPREAMSRLEARIPTSVYEVMEHAATLRGLTLTAYVTATMGEDARRTIEQTSVIRLSRADQIAFAEALINPPAPNAKLIAAARRHAPMARK
jgi:uncharacterized protein (DUF1778 family)